MSGGWLPKRSCSETLIVQDGEDGVGSEKEWTDCGQDKAQGFGI